MSAPARRGMRMRRTRAPCVVLEHRELLVQAERRWILRILPQESQHALKRRARLEPLLDHRQLQTHQLDEARIHGARVELFPRFDEPPRVDQARHEAERLREMGDGFRCPTSENLFGHTAV